MAEFDSILAVKRAAMLAVQKDTSEYNMREIQRWYSMSFSTRLEDVEALPIEDVCQHYFEVKYRDLTPEERDQEMRLLIETKDQRQDRLRREEDDDRDFAREVEEEELRKATKANLAMAQELADTRASIAEALEDPKPISDFEKETGLKEIPEGIEMEFISDEEMDEMSEWDVMGPPPKPKK